MSAAVNYYQLNSSTLAIQISPSQTKPGEMKAVNVQVIGRIIARQTSGTATGGLR
jgi:hypothetical protein